MAISISARKTGLIVSVIGILIVTGLVGVAVVDTAAQQPRPDTDNTVTRIEMDANGSARWTIQIRTRLDTPERVEEYQAFQTRFRNETPLYFDPFRERMSRVVATAANATGREMRAGAFTAETTIQEVPRRWGIVTFRFTWTDFAARTDGRLVVGDVFQGGFFLATDDSLQVISPDGYEISGVEPPPVDREAGVVTWYGREDFADERPRVEFAQATDRETPGAQDATGALAPSDGTALGVFLGGVLVLLVIGASTYVVHRRRSDNGTPEAAPPSPEGQTTERTDGPVMTDAERILALLDDRGGRMRQGEIADALGWSASKTSRVVGGMVESGSVEKLQLGRENLIDTVDDE